MTFVFVSKFFQFAQVLLQFSRLAYPQLQIEVADRSEGRSEYLAKANSGEPQNDKNIENFFDSWDKMKEKAN